MRKLSLALCLLGACATRLPDGSTRSPPPPDFAGFDLTATPASFIGIFTWVNGTSSSTSVCDNGNTGSDPAPSGDFPITPGPGPDQVNIGAGTMSCPIFVFDVGSGSATLSNVGVTCPSGGGTVTTNSGSITTTDGGHTAQLKLILDLQEPDGGGNFVHCRLTVAGNVVRKL